MCSKSQYALHRSLLEPHKQCVSLAGTVESTDGFMKVAQIIFAGSYAGAEHVACLLTQALTEQIERSVLYLILETRAGEQSCKELLHKVRAYEVEVRVFETDRRFSLPLLHQLRAAIHEDQVRVVHCHSYKAAFYAGWIRRFQRNATIRVGFTLHGMDQTKLLHYALIQSWIHLGIAMADFVIGCSQPIASQYQKLPWVRKKIHCIPNGIPIQDKKPSLSPQQARETLQARFHLPTRDHWAAIVGRLVDVKNHSLLLESLRQMKEASDGLGNLLFLVVGDGPLEEQIKQQVQDLGLSEWVYFTGYTKELEELYQAIDLLVLTSTTEGTPMAVLEAFQYGVPAVASSVGGVPALVIDEVTGMLFPSGNSQACREKLVRIFQDKALRRKLGQQAQKHVKEKFSSQHWATRHRELYQALFQG